jgi:membrane-associated phospholipid phosphatase
MQTLQQIDRWIFELINQGCANSFFDFLIPFLREKTFWVPLYVFLIAWCAEMLDRRQFYICLFGLFTTLTITDVISSRLLKPLIGRDRPCVPIIDSSLVLTEIDRVRDNNAYYREERNQGLSPDSIAVLAVMDSISDMEEYGDAMSFEEHIEFKYFSHEDFDDRVIERVPCGSGYSMPSAHAANHFGIAVFLITFFAYIERKYKYAILFWASLICFAQVYVGVHYPFDMLFGALLGGLVGFLVSTYTLRLAK